MDYYQNEQLLAVVDIDDKPLNFVDKWEVHEKNLLHRGFTICLFYNDQIIVQHRKHPVFNGVLDLTCSSHPIAHDGAAQTLEDAAYETLAREWGIKKNDLLEPLNNKGSVCYESKDKNSIYWEHEVCHLLVSKIKKLPSPNCDFAYGYSLFTPKQIKDKKLPIFKALAPWVQHLIKLL